MIRLALRHEGEFWNAYCANMGTMEGAFLIGSIAMGAVMNNLPRERAFVSMMSDIVAEGVEAITGVKPAMVVRDAPPQDRSGNA